jgi:hypothetical protein
MSRARSRRRTVFEGASEAIAKKRDEGATLSEIAEKAGIAETSIYRDFKRSRICGFRCPESGLTSSPGIWNRFSGAISSRPTRCRIGICGATVEHPPVVPRPGVVWFLICGVIDLCLIFTTKFSIILYMCTLRRDRYAPKTRRQG